MSTPITQHTKEELASISVAVKGATTTVTVSPVPCFDNKHAIIGYIPFIYATDDKGRTVGIYYACAEHDYHYQWDAAKFQSESCTDPAHVMRLWTVGKPLELNKDIHGPTEAIALVLAHRLRRSIKGVSLSDPSLPAWAQDDDAPPD